MTKLHINALIACILLAALAGGMLLVGEYCGAAGLAGTIGVVATKFADDQERQ